MQIPKHGNASNEQKNRLIDFIQTVTATRTDGNTVSIEFITKFPDVVKA